MRNISGGVAAAGQRGEGGRQPDAWDAGAVKTYVWRHIDSTTVACMNVTYSIVRDTGTLCHDALDWPEKHAYVTTVGANISFDSWPFEVILIALES